jgi:hypothetical protein
MNLFCLRFLFHILAESALYRVVPSQWESSGGVLNV